jgi:hypothetical protein
MYTKNSTLTTPLSDSLDNIMLSVADAAGPVTIKPFNIGENKRNQVINYEPVPYDMLAQCPKCKSLETVQFINHTLTKRSRFYQKDGKVYHDCGTDRPCQLFH